MTISTGSITTGSALAAYRDELLLFSSGSMFSWSPTTNFWIKKGKSISVQLDEIPIVANADSQFAGNMRQSGSIRVTAWRDLETNTIKAVAQDLQTNTLLGDPTTLVQATSLSDADQVFGAPKVVVGGGFFYVVYLNKHSIKAQRLSGSSPFQWSPEMTWISSGSTTPGFLGQSFDIKEWQHPTSGSVFALANLSGSSYPANFVRLSMIDPVSGSVVTGSNLSGTNFYDVFSLIPIPNDGVHVAYLNATAQSNLMDAYFDRTTKFQNQWFIASGSNDGSGSLALKATGRVVDSSPTGTVEWYVEMDAQDVLPSGSNNHSFNYIKRARTGLTNTSEAIWYRNGSLWGEPFSVNGIEGIGITHESREQASHYLVDLTGTVISRFAPQSADGTAYSVARANYSGSMVSFVYPKVGRFEAVDNRIGARDHVYVGTFDFTPAHVNSQQFGNVLVGTNGTPFIYDGVQATELGFYNFPELKAYQTGSTDHWPSFGTGTLGTGSIPSGTYGYYATYHWTDNLGNEYRSSPGPIASITTTQASSSTITIYVPTLVQTNKSNVTIKLWRTESGEPVPYLITSGTAPLYNSTTASYVQWIDSRRDSEIIGNEILYTYGGEVGNIAPPPSNIIHAHRNRLWLVDETDGLSLWFSKERVIGLGPEFSDEFVITLPDEGGRITALASLDQLLVIFKSNAVYILAGDGPDKTGNNGSFTTPEKMPIELGCINPQSVVQTSDGIFFESDVGIALMNSERNAAYVGAPIEDLVNNLTITSATQIKDINKVRFATKEGIMLNYDTLFQRWTMDTNLSSVDACYFNDRYTILSSSGLVRQETLSVSFVDDTTYYGMRTTTPWLRLSNTQGYQRVWEMLFLGRNYESHILNVTCSFDYDSTNYEIFQVNSSTFASGSVYQFMRNPRVEQCEAIRFSFEDIAQSGSGKAYGIDALQFQIGVIGPNYRLPPRQTF